jgi:hypothetical protein
MIKVNLSLEIPEEIRPLAKLLIFHETELGSLERFNREEALLNVFSYILESAFIRQLGLRRFDINIAASYDPNQTMMIEEKIKSIIGDTPLKKE